MTLSRKRQIAEKVNQDVTEPLKVEFAAGCFDSFEGTQEELDAMIAEVTAMIQSMTPEELAANSRPIDEDSIEDMEPEQVEALIRALEGDNYKRTLQ